MKKLGTTGRTWLKGFHLVFVGVWIGSALSAAIIPFSAVNAVDGSALHGYYLAVKSLDVIVIPAAVLSFISGLLLCWQTAWGFFKHYWVIYSGIVAVVSILLGILWLSPGKDTLLALSGTQGLAATGTEDYIHVWRTVATVSILQVVLLVSTAFISAIKPKHKRRTATQ